MIYLQYYTAVLMFYYRTVVHDQYCTTYCTMYCYIRYKHTKKMEQTSENMENSRKKRAVHSSMYTAFDELNYSAEVPP